MYTPFGDDAGVAFNSLFEMRMPNSCGSSKTETAFNSLFEMHDTVVRLITRRPYYTFNSLFEMHVVCSRQRCQSLYSLSILYLRCIRPTWDWQIVCPEIFLSILYLRCSVGALMRTLNVTHTTFNSLFEMPRRFT